jgi:hypothetical protein
MACLDLIDRCKAGTWQTDKSWQLERVVSSFLFQKELHD